MAAERERSTLESDQRLALTELELLQKDFDAVSTTVRMLEMQKSEAQKRLDELDDKVLYECTSPCALLIWIQYSFLFS